MPQCWEQIGFIEGYCQGQGRATWHKGDKQIPKQGFLGVNPGSAFLGYFGKLLNLSGLQFSHLKKGVDNSTQSPELVGGLYAISMLA